MNIVPNLLIILTGKTTSGKDTIMARLLSKYPDLKRVISTTSRPIRDNEKNGVDYYFVTEAEFNRKRQNGDFIEYIEYGDNLYGTEKSQLVRALGASLIWRIDPSRAGQIRQFIVNSFDPVTANQLLINLILIYLNVDNAVILQRLKSRGLPEKEINLRLQEDLIYWEKYKNRYDYVIENIPGRLDDTLKQISQIIEAQNTKV